MQCIEAREGPMHLGNECLCVLGAQDAHGKKEMRARLAWHFYREGAEDGGDNVIRFVFLEDPGGWWGVDYS